MTYITYDSDDKPKLKLRGMNWEYIASLFVFTHHEPAEPSVGYNGSYYVESIRIEEIEMFCYHDELEDDLVGYVESKNELTLDERKDLEKQIIKILNNDIRLIEELEEQSKEEWELGNV